MEKSVDAQILAPIGDEAKPRGPLDWLLTNAARVLVALFVPIVTFITLYAGFIFLRDSDAPKIVVALVAIAWGVGGVAALYAVSNWLVEHFNQAWRTRILPFIFVGPAIAILIWYLALPTVRTFWASLFSADGAQFVGLANYLAIFTDRNMFTAFRNNLMWIIFGASFVVIFGLLVAVLADRTRWETAAKVMIFMPMAISMVGAAVIFNMLYAPNPDIGLLNAIYTGITGNDPIAWKASAELQPWNNLFLIFVMIWLQVGFAMVLFSAALKGIPTEILEAARVDGATELQVFFQIMLPMIMGTIITVTTTVIIFTLKIFDVVWVMTGGQFSTQVIATQFYREYFTAQNAGFGSAIAIVLLLCVIPVMIYNIRGFNERQAF
jgi:alpha-glucoside transport system permease protein